MDRGRGWMFGRPTTKLGLTGEMMEHLLLDSSWGEIGVPTIITSGQGPHFTDEFWRTIGARLGVSQAFLQARRPKPTEG